RGTAQALLPRLTQGARILVAAKDQARLASCPRDEAQRLHRLVHVPAARLPQQRIDPSPVLALRTHRVGGRRIAGEQGGLAAAATMLLVAIAAGPAGAVHPGVAAVPVECLAVEPGRAHGGLAHVREV